MSRHGSDWNPRCSDSVVSQWKDEGEQARGGGGGETYLVYVHPTSPA